MYLKPIIQPSGLTTIRAICDRIKSMDIEAIDIAVAYITTSGLREFRNNLESALGNRWPNVKKRWVTSLDYMRTEPTALQAILKMPRSKLRIHNGSVVKNAGCIPFTPFHPKVFLTSGGNAERVIAGSGNLSRSGLCRGHEAGIAVGISKPLGEDEATSQKVLVAYKSWFKVLWRGADACDDELMAHYRKVYQAVPNLRNPAPTDDDIIPFHPNQLTSGDLRKLRACENFWIEAGNISKNLGQNRPGNQLMMKRLSRVFFGVPPIDVPQNSPLTHMRISFDGNEERPCSLTFSDNGMDKLTLPAPGFPGPVKYDNENLLFKRTGPDSFALQLGTAAQKSAWLKRSKAIEADFSMSSGGRIWGVF